MVFSKTDLHIPCLTLATCLNHQSPVFQSASTTTTPMWDHLIILFQLQMLHSIKWDNKTIINYEYLESLLIYQKVHLEELRNLDQDSQKHSCNYLTFMEPCIARCVFYEYITNEMQLIRCPLSLSALYTFRAVFPPIVRSLQNSMCSLGYCHAFQLSTAGVVGVPPQPHQR